MGENLKHLFIDEEENIVVPVKSFRDAPTVTYNFCMVGMFLTYNSINLQNIKYSLTDLWHPIGGVAIMELGGKTISVSFF